MKDFRSTWRRLRARADHSSEAGFTLPEMLIVVVLGTVVTGVLASAFMVTTNTTKQAKTRLDESHDTQMVAAFFNADAANASYYTNALDPARTGACDSFAFQGPGESLVGMFEWVEGAVTKAAFYGTAGSPTNLTRRYCENGVQQSDVTLVRHVGSPAPVITCPTGTCSAESTYLELAVEESTGYDYTLRADPRTTGTTPSGLMGDIAIYIGLGGATTNGTKTHVTVPDGLVVTEGDAKCNGEHAEDPAFDAEDGFFAPPTSLCATITEGAPITDPLKSVPQPVEADYVTTPTWQNTGGKGKPKFEYQPSNSNVCGTKLPTYEPGIYPEDVSMAGGCLATGTYYFQGSADLTNMKSADGGVLLFLEDEGLKLTETTLHPLATGPRADITVFAARTNGDQIETYNNVTVYGTIYAAAGVLNVQGDKSALEAGSINVYTLTFGGNSEGLIIV